MVPAELQSAPHGGARLGGGVQMIEAGPPPRDTFFKFSGGPESHPLPVGREGGTDSAFGSGHRHRFRSIQRSSVEPKYVPPPWR
jgi:hypothetical protein